MNVQLEVQYGMPLSPDFPAESDFLHWVKAALASSVVEEVVLTIRIVDSVEMQYLNREYRHQDKPTNVLSFPFEPLPNQETNYLGDIAICASVVIEEAQVQHKMLLSHWAHMTIHGVLHLLGYDHEDDHEAEVMEQLETEVMIESGFPDPYLN